MLLYIILEKNMKTEYTSVHSVYDDETLAREVFSELLSESDEDTFAYKLDFYRMKTAA